ncbi:MAG TPA: hypothetical protein VF013_03390 [Candidatus Limnocylindria bacterium]
MSLVAAVLALAASGCGAADATPASVKVTPQPTPAGGPHRLSLDGLAAELTVTLPPGWESDATSVSRTGEDAQPMGLSVWLIHEIYADPCHWRGTATVVGTTAAEVAAALEAQPMRHARHSRVDLAGRTAEFVTLTVPDTDLAACDDGEFRSWTDANGPPRTQSAEGQVDEVYVVDVDGTALVIDAAYSRDASTEERATIHRLVQSLQISEVAASPSASG